MPESRPVGPQAAGQRETEAAGQRRISWKESSRKQAVTSMSGFAKSSISPNENPPRKWLSLHRKPVQETVCRSGRPQALVHGCHALPVDDEDVEDYSIRRRDRTGDQRSGIGRIGVVLRQRKLGRQRCPSLLFDGCGTHNAGAGEHQYHGVRVLGHPAAVYWRNGWFESRGHFILPSLRDAPYNCA